MPLYDCVMLLKPRVTKEATMDLIARVGKHVYARNGVITEIKPIQNVELGYGIKKLDGRYYQGQMTQMTMMATPNINKELQYLNKEDRLLRWLLVKHRDEKHHDTNFDLLYMNNYRSDPSSGNGLSFLDNEIASGDVGNVGRYPRYSIFANNNTDDDSGDEYEIDAEETDAGNRQV